MHAYVLRAHVHVNVMWRDEMYAMHAGYTIYQVRVCMYVCMYVSMYVCVYGVYAYMHGCMSRVAAGMYLRMYAIRCKYVRQFRDLSGLVSFA